MWILLLNPIRGSAEDLEPVAKAMTRESLEKYMDSQRGPWVDAGIQVPIDRTNGIGPMNRKLSRPYRLKKEFRRGSPLEWFNPLESDNDKSFVDVGSEADAVETFLQDYPERLRLIPSAD